MKPLLSAVMAIGMLLALSGCATTGNNSPTQAEVQRISPEELEKLIPPPVATVSLEELVADAKQGKTADDIIEKIKASNSRYDLTPAQTVDLNKRGLDTKVLDYIHAQNELAKQNAIADEMNKRAKEKAQAEKQLRRERDLARMRSYDPYWGFYYGRPWFGGPFGYAPYGYGFGPRFGWGMGYGGW